MTAEIIDFNIIALEALSRKALESGNPFESYAMAQLIDGYREGLWKINWQGGEPIFEAALSAEEIRKKYSDQLLD